MKRFGFASFIAIALGVALIGPSQTAPAQLADACKAQEQAQEARWSSGLKDAQWDQ